MASGSALAERVEVLPKADGPWMLPMGWGTVRIGVVARLRSEKADPQADAGLRFVGMDDIQTNGLKVCQSRAFSQMKSLGNRFQAGDLLYGRLRPYLNKTAVVREEGACSGELLVIEPTAAIDVRYLQYFMHSRRFVGWVSSVTSGDRPRISFETAAGFEIPLAPLAEQRRVVARVDALFSEIDEGEAALAMVRKRFDTFHRALLKAAVTGELTKDWRATNPVSETGHGLLAHIAKVRAAMPPTKGRTRRNADAPPLDPATLSPLPDGWAWTRWRDVGESQNGRPFPSGSYADSGVRLLRPGNLFADGHVRWSKKNTRFLPANFAATNEGLIVRGGELVINLTAQSLKDEFLGRVCITDDDEYCLLNQRLGRLTPIGIDSGYMLLVLKSSLFRTFVDGMNTGSLIQHMFTSQIENFCFPLPPPAEAAEILRRVSEALAASADTLTVLDAEASDAVQLRQSILKAAFEGRLVPQDLADEPVSALLARLAEQPAIAAVRRGRTRKSP